MPDNFEGTIAAVDPSSLTLNLKDGSSQVFVLTPDTRVNIPGLGHKATVADLKVGDNVSVHASRGETGALLASMIDVEMPKPEQKHYDGIVTAYLPGVSLSIQDKEGASFSFLITSETRIMLGPKDNPGELAVGASVSVDALQDAASGSLTAIIIVVHPKEPKEPENYHGTIASVNASSLTLTLKDGSTLTFAMNADTKVRIPDLGHNATIADLKVGDVVTVRASQDNTGALVALEIMVEPGKPDFMHHVGTVTDYQPGVSITIQDKDGNPFTFLVTDQTKILPPDRASQLAVGVIVTIVAPRSTESGTPTAMVIVVHPPRPCDTDDPEHGSTCTATSTATFTPTDTLTSTASATPTDTATPTP